MAFSDLSMHVIEILYFFFLYVDLNNVVIFYYRRSKKFKFILKFIRNTNNCNLNHNYIVKFKPKNIQPTSTQNRFLFTVICRCKIPIQYKLNYPMYFQISISHNYTRTTNTIRYYVQC